jgi:ribosomal-protein-alanine N-acetyltransferase
MKLETKRTTLRTFQSSDFNSLRNLMTNNEVMKHTGFEEAKPLSFIKEKLSQWEKSKDIWAVIEKENSQLIGWFMLKETFSIHPELGFMIEQSYWNKGYATEVSILLLKVAKNQLHAHKVIATINPQNYASKKVLEKIGMLETNELTDPSRSEDLIYFHINL